MKKSIYSIEYNKLKQLLTENGLKSFAAKQIYDWLYKKLVNSFVEMTNISKINHDFLNNNFYFDDFKLKKILEDQNDGTIKFLFELEDKNLIETVIMKFDYGYSICVTSQVGCNMGCKFCASGLLKKIRNLETNEIVNQVVYVQKYLNKINNGQKSRISNVVVMGIGEPFDNLDNVNSFINIIKDDLGLQIGARHITVSTCGIVPKILEFGQLQNQVGLAISLHAPNNDLRSKIMPINNAYDINELIKTIDKYIAMTNRRVTFEYILLDGINDSKECAIELSNLLKDKLCYVNLIPYNVVSEHSNFRRSNNVKMFFQTLNSNGVLATIRQERGLNIDAACGQLRAKNIGK